MSVIVKWGRERLHIPLPPPDTKLGAIRRSLAEYTHLPEGSIKLIYAGAVMKDDNAPISYYQIRPNSTIALISPPPPNSSAPSTTAYAQQQREREREKERKRAEPKTEQSSITQIQEEVERVRKTLEPGVNEFLDGLHPQPTSTASSAPPQPQHTSAPPASKGAIPAKVLTPAQEHTRLSELLLQSLLRLDAIPTDGAWEKARLERKGAVREVQGLLDRLDGGWGAR